MSKNLIPEIAKLLGLEIGEEFKIDVHEDFRYKFSDNTLEFSSCEDDVWFTSDGTSLYLLLRGVYKVVKLPWKPKIDEKFWTFIGIDFCIWQDTWQGSAMDYAILNSNIIFRTEAEAIEKRPEVYKELTGKEWQENE